jgi:hypothetical protein
MSKSNEAIQFDGKGASYAKYLNEDVRLVVESTGKQVDNMADMVNQVNLDKDLIKAYCDEFASMLKANGKDDDTVKQMKATRKCILDFGAGLRKGQLDQPELWSKGEGKQMIEQHFRKQAGSLNQLAKLCRDATAIEEPPKPWDLGEKMNALIEKALEEEYSMADIQKAFKELTADAPKQKAA